jgi:hypothetical protein
MVSTAKAFLCDPLVNTEWEAAKLSHTRSLNRARQRVRVNLSHRSSPWLRRSDSAPAAIFGEHAPLITPPDSKLVGPTTWDYNWSHLFAQRCTEL